MLLDLIIRHGVIIAFLILLAIVAIARVSQSTPHLGLQDGRLRPCPKSPNCVCSEDNSQFGIPFSGSNPDAVWQTLTEVVIAIGGRIEEDHVDYMHAEFTSRIFGFVDDLELHMDREKQVIHLRSASRVGYSDMGVNQKRVDRLLAEMQNKLAE